RRTAGHDQRSVVQDDPRRAAQAAQPPRAEWAAAEPGGRPTVSDLVDGLLGPDEPEVSCEVCFDELDRYVELELDGADADTQVPGMGAHLAGCPARRAG